MRVCIDRCLRVLVPCILVSLSASAPLFAAPGIDGEFAAVWWSNDLTTDDGATSTSTDAGAPGFRAELWMLERYGLRGSQYSSSVDEIGGDGADYTSLDVMWRAFAPTKNDFLAVGLGWQRSDLGLDDAASGMRVSMEGRVGFTNAIHAYGQGSYLPSMGDGESSSRGMSFADMKGFEVELGMAFRLAPFVALHAGYRAQQIDFTEGGFGSYAVPTVTMGVHPVGNSGAISHLQPRASEPSGTCTVCSLPGSELDGSTGSKGYFIGLGVRF